MKSILQPGQLQVISWAEAFGGSPVEEQEFIKDLNKKGESEGMLLLDPDIIGSFISSFVVVDWMDRPAAHAAHKITRTSKFHDAKIAVIGSVCSVMYPGKGLAKVATTSAATSAASSGVDFVHARTGNPKCREMLEELYFEVMGMGEDGKSELYVSAETILQNLVMPNMMAIDLPTFTDGGKYD